MQSEPCACPRRLHEHENLTKPQHSVFNGDSVKITNKAWSKRHLGTIDSSGRNIVYKIPYKNAGYTSGSVVAISETCNGVAIVIQRGTTNLLVTAFPIVL